MKKSQFNEHVKKKSTGVIHKSLKFRLNIPQIQQNKLPINNIFKINFKMLTQLFLLDVYVGLSFTFGLKIGYKDLVHLKNRYDLLKKSLSLY